MEAEAAISYYRQHSDEDFAPAFNVIDLFFKNLAWLKI